MINIGFPIGMQFVFETGAFAAAAFMVGWMGKIQLAAHQIALSLASATYMAASGIAQATTVRVGNFLGKNDLLNLRRAAFTSYGLVSAFMGICAVFFILFRWMLPHLFTNDAEVAKITSGLLVVAAFFQLSDGIQVSGLGILRGMKDVKRPTLIALIAYWFIGLPTAYIFGFVINLGINGIWWGLATGLTAAGILLFYRFHQQTRNYKMQSA